MDTTMADTSEMQQWLAVNETAKTMLKRLAEWGLPSLAPMPPFHRVALHGGHVLEIAGPSGSGKSELLLQAAVSCILPREWEGLSLGGSGKPTVFFDLDCRLDMLRLVHLLQSRVYGAQALQEYRENAAAGANSHSTVTSLDNLMRTCLKRFYLKRCHNSFEFLAALKTTLPQLKQLVVEHGSSAQLLMIDSIGAFYWLDRTTRSVPGEAGRGYKKSLRFMTVSGAVVNEIRQLAQTYPQLLVMTTKTNIYKGSGKDLSGSLKRGPHGRNHRNTYRTGFSMKAIAKEEEFASRSSTLTSSEKIERSSHREYMPAVWREFVSHRLLLQGPFQPGSPNVDQTIPYFTAVWDKPSSTHVDRFIIQDDGVKLVV